MFSVNTLKTLNLNNQFIFFSFISCLYLFLRHDYFFFLFSVPDEVWHVSYVKNLDIAEVVNYQSFGQIYWIFLKLLNIIFKDNIFFVLRTLALLSVVYTGLILLTSFKVCSKNIINYFITIIFFSTPFFWYPGKIITPEFYLLPILALSIKVCSSNKNFSLSFFLAGLAVGVKLTCLPIIIVLTLLLIFFNKSNEFKMNLSSISLLFFCFSAGFLSANPIIIYDFNKFLFNLSENTSLSHSLANLFNLNSVILFFYNFFLNKKYAWDFVLISGVHFSVFNIFSLLGLAFCIVLYARRYFIVLLVYIFSLVLMVYINQKNFIWYAFTLAIIPTFLFFLAVNQNPSKQKTKFKLTLACVISVFIIFFNTMTIYENFNPHFKLNELYKFDSKNKDLVSHCLIDKLNNSSNMIHFTRNNFNFVGLKESIEGLFDYTFIVDSLGFQKIETLNNESLSSITSKYNNISILDFNHINIPYEKIPSNKFEDSLLLKSSEKIGQCGNIVAINNIYISKK